MGEAKKSNELFVCQNGCYCLRQKTENGKYKLLTPIDGFMSAISNVEVVNDTEGNPKAVITAFYDGTKFKATALFGDKFDLERGIEICVGNKAIGDLIGDNTYGKSVFSKIVAKGVKRYYKELKRKEAIKEREEAIARKEEKKRKKHQAWVAKCKERAKREKIEIIKQAFLEAFQQIKPESNEQ